MITNMNWCAMEEDLVDAADTLLEDPSASMEKDFEQIVAQEGDEALTMFQGEMLDDDIAGMEEQHEVLNTSLQAGGMTPVGIMAVHKAVSRYANKYGIRTQAVAQEDFDDTASREQATNVAMEGLKEMVANAWTSFMKWLRDIIAKGKEKLAGFTNAGKSIKKRAEKLEEAIAKGFGVKDKDKVSGGWIKSCVIDEKVNWTGTLEFANKTLAEMLGAAAEIGTSVNAESGKLQRAAAGQKVGDGASLPSSVANFGEKTSKKLQVPNGATDVKVSGLPGNSYLLKYKNNKGDECINFVQAPFTPNEKKLAPLSAADCTAAAKSMYKLGDALETKLKAVVDSNKQLEGLNDAVDKAAKATKDVTPETRDAINAALSSARQGVINFKATERAATTTARTVAEGINGYVKASIGAYKKA